MHAFADLALAAYCPRKLYYRRREPDRDPPPEVERARELAFRYEPLLADPDRLADEPIAVDPAAWRRNLRAARGGEYWQAVVDPQARDVFASGRDCRGIVHKVLDLDGPAPGMIAAGRPPDDGVWEPDSVRAVAAAKALAWEHETPVERAVVEYPTHGVVRPIRITTRRTAAYRRALRAAESIDGPPPRLRGSNKCEPCEYRESCGVKTRTLGSLLG